MRGDEADRLAPILTAFKHFLRGAGFIYVDAITATARLSSGDTVTHRDDGI